MFNRRLSPWIRSAVMLAALSFALINALAQEQKLPDAPTPQNNAPAPSANLPSQTPDDQGSSSSGNPEAPSNTRSGTQQSPEPANPQPPPPGSEGVKTVPAGQRFQCRGERSR